VSLEEIISLDAPGTRVLLLGNEAIARGAIEGGIGVFTTYPGTPASEIADTLALVAKRIGMYMEYSTNEKVAMEVAGAAAIAGVRAMTAMKHVGLNVAADPFMTLAYVGVNAGMIVVSADDPSCWSSQNEQDNRYYALLSGVPMLEPANPQEAKDMVLYGLRISEELKLPVLLRTTTRISHMRADVTLGPIQRPSLKGSFEKDPQRYVPVPAHARRLHIALLEKMEKAKEISEKCEFNAIIEGEGTSEYGVITSGAAFNCVMDALHMLNIDVDVLKLGMTNPLPEQIVIDFLKRCEKVIVVEELEPYLELQVKMLAYEHGLNVKILGKREGLLPRFHELSPDVVLNAICNAFGIKHHSGNSNTMEVYEKEVKEILPPRPPILCPGCPHRAIFYAVKEATKGKAVYPTDIGCYTLVLNPPLKTADILFCMGSSIGTSCGLSKVLDSAIVAGIGDSTFFHAGIPGLINAVYNKHKFVLVIAGNETTAMTGHQPHPGTGITGLGEKSTAVAAEDVAKGCGVKFVKVVDPYNLEETIRAIKEALEADEVAVIVARRKCALLATRERFEKGEKIIPYKVDPEACKGCKICITRFGCPAIVWNGKHAQIVEELCIGCGVCAQVCPHNAIGEAK